MITLEAFKVDEEQNLLPDCASRAVRWWSLICMGVIAALDSPLTVFQVSTLLGLCTGCSTHFQCLIRSTCSELQQVFSAFHSSNHIAKKITVVYGYIPDRSILKHSYFTVDVQIGPPWLNLDQVLVST